MNNILYLFLSSFWIPVLLIPSMAQATSKPTARPVLVLEEFVFENSPFFRSCHAATMLELGNGDLLCAFFGGSREGASDVEVWLSRKSPGSEWTAPMSAADGHGNTVFNPVLFQPEGGDIMLFYKCPDINTGEVVTSSDNGYTWSSPRQLPKGFVGPIVNKPVQLDDGSIIAGSSLQDDPGWRIHVERSSDNGQTWTKIGPLSDTDKYRVIQPTILVHSEKRLQLLMRSSSSDLDTKIPQTWSEDGGLTWSRVTDTTLPNNNSGLDAVTLKDGRHLLVYNHSTRTAPGTGRKGRGILTMAVTNDGINWEAALVLDYRTGSVQYSYPAVIQTKDGLVHVAYTWHRKRIKHVVIDPNSLKTYPIVNGQWPKDKIPWIESEE